MSIQLIDKVSNTSDLLGKEGQWAYRLQTIRPLGLNENDFFYSQNRRAPMAQLVEHRAAMREVHNIYIYIYIFFFFFFN